ncbi:MAG TPA: phospholipase [Actinomycetota bacterium]|jgi:phospholipase/carboxylesterase|nr:phospholipase [Actinomycetota bacterium]
MVGVGVLDHRVRPSQGEPQGALLLLHGRGADHHDLWPLLDALDPGRRLIGVTARGPLSLPPGGWHWYVLGGIGHPDKQSFTDTFAVLGGWLDAWIESRSLEPDQLIIGGFSQGAVMSHALAFAHGRPRPRALLAFSGFMPTVEGFEMDLGDLGGMPVAIGHGTYDPVIGVEWGRQARDRLEAAGADVLYRESPMGHTIDPAFVQQVARSVVGRPSSQNRAS